MNNNIIVNAIQLALVVTIIGMAIFFIFQSRRRKINLFQKFFTGLWIGVITDMLDTLGIGSFATTTTFFKTTKLVDDDSKIPGTMNAVHNIPALMQSLCFISVVQVDLTTLFAMVIASGFGAIFGTRITKNWHTPTVQKILGSLLVIAASIMVFRMLTNPGGDITNSATGLSGIWLLLGIAFNFLCGALMTIGLGNYAPELIFFSLLGLSPAIAMPIMMLNAATVMTVSSISFVRDDRVNWKGFAGIVIGGVIGVLIAVLFLTNLDVTMLKWLVVGVVIYTGVTMIRDSLKASPQKRPEKARVTF